MDRQRSICSEVVGTIAAILWLEADAAPERRRIEDAPVGDDAMDAAGHADVIERVAVEDDQIAAFPFSMVPLSAIFFITRAGTTVAADSASNGDIPAWT